MTARWRILGAGSILPRAGFGCAGHALQRSNAPGITLFDCGPGTVRALGAAGIALRNIERVAISHFHPDHWLDLLALAFARRNPALAPVTRLEIVGPRGLAELLERAASIFGERSWLRFDSVDVREVDPSDRGAALVRGPLRFSWAATGHTPESVAWRVDIEDSVDGAVSVCYSGDSGEVASLAELAREVDLFVCECSFPDEAAVEHHLTPSSAGRLARASGCRKLVLTHFYPVLDPEAAREGVRRYFQGPIEISKDGSEHAIGMAE